MHGRFTSPDEFKGGPDELFDFEEDASDNPTFYADLSNPQSLNKYQYSYNNPYKFNDPDGHCPPCTAQEVLPMPWITDLIIPKIGPIGPIGPGPIILPNGNTYQGKVYVDEGGNLVDENFNIIRAAPRSISRNQEGVGQEVARVRGRRNVEVRHSSRKKAKEAGEFPRPGKKLPQPKKSAPRAKKEAYEDQQKYRRPERHPDSPHNRKHFHDADKNRQPINRHHVYPGSQL